MGWVLFFDGECAFCSASVRRVARLDRRGWVDFAPLQGSLSEQIGLSKHAADVGGTLVLLREADGKIFTRSDALIELAQILGGVWKIAMLGRFVPRLLRDAIYRFVADHRKLLMSKSASCALPDPELMKRLRK